MKKDLWPFKLMLIFFFLVVFIFLLYPLAVMIVSSFRTPGTAEWTLGNYIDIFTKSKYTSAFSNSILLSIYSSIVGLIVTVIATYAVVSRFPRLRDLFLALANLTTNYVGVQLAFGFIILLGNAGIITLLDQQMGWHLLDNFSIYSIAGLLLVYIYFQLPLGITLLLPIFDALDKYWRESAQLLGASSFDYWRRIALPVLAPSLMGVLAILFANALGTYDSAVALTGNSINLISTQIGNTVQGDIFARPELGSALSVILGIILAFNIYMSELLGKRLRRDIP